MSHALSTASVPRELQSLCATTQQLCLNTEALPSLAEYSQH